MEKYISPEETLSEIRQMMERSSRFISLSGLSGVLAGVYALLGILAAYWLVPFSTTGTITASTVVPEGAVPTLAAIAATVLVLAVGTGILLTTRKARKDGNSLLDAAARKLIVNLCIPLVAGGVFCAAVVYHGGWYLVVPVTLIFYGLALVHASKYTRDDVRSLGIVEIVLGMIALFITEYHLVFWGLGFGVMHIGYGVYMYLKYEK